MSSEQTQRAESDSLGKIDVPADRYWGAQTERSLHFFNIGCERMPLELIRAFGLQKKACASANFELGLLPETKAKAIVQACDEVLSGKWDMEFPLHVWQTGSGTQTHMNVNEVLANRASEILGGALGSKKPVHPNDDVNLGQSSNDSFPTAMHLASVERIHARLLPALALLEHSLNAISVKYERRAKIGRTHLQDAVPMTVGQEFGAFAFQISQNKLRLTTSLDGLYELAQGGTAVGTGLNSHPEFGRRVAEKLAQWTSQPFRISPNRFAALSAHDPIVWSSAALRTLAVSLFKMANDIRLLASGPRCGIGELRLPENEPGSSIMPGKVNPTQCEALAQICIQVQAMDTAISIAGAQGPLQLNVYKPLIIFNFLGMIRLLSDGIEHFVKFCLDGLEINAEVLEAHLERSLMLVTALAPHIGYDRAAEIAKNAYREKLTLREAAIATGWVRPEQFDQWVDVNIMVGR